MSIKRGEATIKDLSTEEMNKVIELARRLGEEKKQKQHFKNLYEELKIQHEQLKKEMTKIIEIQEKNAEENKYLKLQLKNSLRKLEPLRSSFVSTRSGEGKEDEDPNIAKEMTSKLEKSAGSVSGNKKKEISDLKSEIQKMSKQLKYYTPPLPFIQKSRIKQKERESQKEENDRSICQETSLMEQKMKAYETIKSRYQHTQSQSFIDDEATKICMVEKREAKQEYVTARKSKPTVIEHKQSMIHKNNFYSSDLLDLVEMLE